GHRQVARPAGDEAAARDVRGGTGGCPAAGIGLKGLTRPHPNPSGTNATILTGPPEPPAIFIGRAITQAPVSGSSSRFATFSNPGTLAPRATWWTMKSFDGP